MSLFLKKIFVFTFLLAIFCILAFALTLHIGKSSGELLSLDKIIEIQQRDDVLHASAVQNITPYLKYKTTDLLNPDILVIGTSRVSSIWQEHFIDDVSFYNAGFATQNLPSYYDFIETIDVSPKFIIFNLDQWQFNQNYFNTDSQKSVSTRYDYKHGYRYTKTGIHLGIFRMLREENFKIAGKFIYPKNIGLTAVVYGEGFRKDGSYYSKRMIDAEDYKDGVAYKSSINRIGKDMFVYGDDELYEESIKQVDRILRLCKDKNIRVVAFMPPFAPSVYTQLMENGHFSYMAKVHPALLPVFEQYGFELYDFTDASDITDDSMTYDGYHPDDRAAYKMLLSMKEQGSVIGQFVRPE